MFFFALCFGCSQLKDRQLFCLLNCALQNGISFFRFEITVLNFEVFRLLIDSHGNVGLESCVVCNAMNIINSLRCVHIVPLELRYKLFVDSLLGCPGMMNILVSASFEFSEIFLKLL